MTQKFLVYQSMWAMERLRSDGLEYSLDEKLGMIRDAGFDGAGVRFTDPAFVKPVTDFLRAHNMTWQAQGYPQTVDDLKLIIAHVQEFGAEHINIQPDIRPYTLEACYPLIDGWRQLAADAGIKLHIETHRNRMTNDLLFTLHLLDRYPDLRLTGDLSHYVVGRELWYPLSDADNALIGRILSNCWGFHGRVASCEQVQVQLNFAQHKPWVDMFMAWWESGFRQWKQKAGNDETLTFLCELGPAPYAITGADGKELSDRWAEAQQMKAMVKELWQKS